MTLPDDTQAHQFAVMLQAGLPAAEAITYFVEDDDPGVLADALRKWQRSARVRAAMLALMGKAWQEMTTEERMRYALDLHYSQLATFLYTHNYNEVGQSDKAKADTARVALEAKLAGQAGAADPLTRFYEDLKTGRLKLQNAPGSTIGKGN